MYQSMPIAALGAGQILGNLVSFLPATGDKQKPSQRSLRVAGVGEQILGPGIQQPLRFWITPPRVAQGNREVLHSA